MDVIPRILQQPPDDKPPFGDEDTAAAHELGFTDRAVLGQPDIVRIDDGNLGHPAGRLRYH
jgi:hypothetical protein